MHQENAYNNKASLRRLNWLCILILSVLPFIIFWPVTSGFKIWAVGDFASYQVPMNTIASEQWRQGVIPLWNPYMDGGTPLAATQNPGIFYPLDILLWLLLPAWMTLGYSILIHLALIGCGTFFFIRSLKLHPVAALLGGLVFQWSGFVLGHLGHVMFLRALPWIGFSLYAFNSWIDSKKARYLAGICVSIGFLYCSGYPQIILYASLLIASYFALARRVNFSQFTLASSAFVLGIGLSAIQLIPGLNLYSSNEFLRPGEGMYSVFTNFSFHPAYVVTFLFPLARGGNLSEMVGYIGIAPFFLALIAIWTSDPEEDTRVKRFFISWSAISLILALGPYVKPLAEWSFRIPIYGSFGAISRHLLELVFSMSVLAAMGLEEVMRHRWIKRLRWSRIAALGFCIVVIGLLAVFSPFSGEMLPLKWSPVFRTILKPVLFMVIAAGLIYALSRSHRRTGYLVFFGICLLTVVDLADFGVPIYSDGLTSPDFYTTLPRAATLIRQNSISPDPFRIISFEAPGAGLERSFGKEILAANYNATYGMESLIGHEGLQLRRFNAAFGGRIRPWGAVEAEWVEEPHFRALLDLFGVKYLLARTARIPLLSKFYKPLASVGQVGIFENVHAKPRLFKAEPPGMDLSKSQNFGHLVSLLRYRIKTINPENPDHPIYLLVTTWYCPNPLPQDLALYIRYLDRSGATSGQWDHVLGTRLTPNGSITRRWISPGIYRDESFIPSEVIDNGALHIAFGIQRPDTGVNVPSSGKLPVDEKGRTRIEMSDLKEAEREDENILVDEFGKEWVTTQESPKNPETIRYLYYDGHHLGAELNWEKPGLLIHGTNFVSGWKAKIDAKEVPVLRIQDAVQGILVPEGKHRVEFFYQPDGFRQGVVCSLLSLALLGFLCYLARHQQKDSASK